MPNEYQMLYANDFKLDNVIDPIELIRYNVFKRNEAWDIFIQGFRGNGKSTVGLGLALMLNPRLQSYKPKKILDKCWCFTMEEHSDKSKTSRRGDVLCFDEQGTQVGGSSHKWQKKENQDYADTKQLDRTDGVINVGISLDQGRVIKRVRELYRVDVYPEKKVQTAEGEFAIDCIVREVVQNPFANGDSDRFGKKYFNYADKGRIARWRIMHPSEDLWNEYSNRRDEFKNELRELGEIKNGTAKPKEESTYDKIIRLNKQN